MRNDDQYGSNETLVHAKQPIKHKLMKTQFLTAVICSLLVTSCITLNVELSESTPEVEKEREARLLTAFFGLDNELPLRSRVLSKKAPGKDGMPIVFSQEVDPSTVDASDIEITTADGSKFFPDDATLKPAGEPFELRTLLLVGNYGNYPDNEPVSVKIVGDLLSRYGQNFKGQEIEVIPLAAGPVLSYAEYFDLGGDYPYVEEGRGCDCPRGETLMVVKAVWSGGVRALNGKDLGADEIDDFSVTMVQGRDTVVVNPFQLADLGDNDNNIDLCLKEAGIPIRVKVNANVAIDPRDDPNAETEVGVVSRW